MATSSFPEIVFTSDAEPPNLPASSGNFAILDSSNRIWVSNADYWNPLPPLPGESPILSVTTDGAIYATSNQGDRTVLYQYDPGIVSMVKVGSVPYSTPPAGSIGNLWTLNDGQAFCCTDNPFNPQTSVWYQRNTEDWLNDGDIPQSVFVTNDNTAWLFCNTQAVYSQSCNSARWLQLSPPPGVIAIAPLSASSFYALCNENGSTLYCCDRNGSNTVRTHGSDSCLDLVQRDRWDSVGSRLLRVCLELAVRHLDLHDPALRPSAWPPSVLR